MGELSIRESTSAAGISIADAIFFCNISLKDSSGSRAVVSIMSEGRGTVLKGPYLFSQKAQKGLV